MGVAVSQPVKITTYGCKEYLCRVGLLEGSLEFQEVWPRRITIAEIQRAVAERFDVSPDVMTSASTTREDTQPRQVSMYLAGLLTTKSKTEIARRHGKRDHTTVVAAFSTVKKLMRADPEFRSDVMQARKAVVG
jgi:chromosomal replication initiation ATPase DnaA